MGAILRPPEGTEVVVSVTVNKVLEKAALVLNGGEEMALKNRTMPYGKACCLL